MRFVMSDENTLGASGLFDEVRKGVNTFIDKMESEQAKVNRAFISALDMNQRSRFYNNLEDQGVPRKRMAKMAGVDESTISRTINYK